uniref:C-type lectin domain-containing protein n=1 Tax=Acrobeloides nanus TaxID=290746 RepID=A0A914C579_9BILA
MYNYKLAVLFLLCCFLLVGVTDGCGCRHRKKHRKSGSGSSDTHSSESSSESSEHHKKHHSTAPANRTTAAPPKGSTAAPANGSTAAPPTRSNAAPATASTAAPPTRSTSLPGGPTTTFSRPTCCPSDLTRTGQPTSNVNSGVWIGLKAVVTGKSFEWTDGSPVDYTKWAVSSNGNEPDGAGQFGSPANCVDVHPDTLTGLEALTNAWDDDNCWAVMRAFVCKQSVQNC